MAAHGHGTLTNHVTPSRTLLGRGSHRDRDESRVTIVIIRVTAMIDSPSCDDNCPSPMPGHGHGHRDRSPGRDSARSPGRDSARTRYAMIMASHHHRVRATGTSHQHDGMIMISHQWHDHDHESSWHDLSGLGLSDRHESTGPDDPLAACHSAAGTRHDATDPSPARRLRWRLHIIVKPGMVSSWCH